MEAQMSFGMTPCSQKTLAQNLFDHIESALDALESLEQALVDVLETKGDALEEARYYHGKVVPVMEILRSHVDELERLTEKSYWPYPSYEDMLFHL
jgi:glutamine synthetase